jgi:hypothetical protein
MREEHNPETQFRNNVGFSISSIHAHGEGRGQVPLKPLPFVILARGGRQLGFWGASTRLPNTATADRHLLLLLPGELLWIASSSRREEHRCRLHPLPQHDAGDTTRVGIIGVWTVHLLPVLCRLECVCFNSFYLLFHMVCCSVSSVCCCLLAFWSICHVCMFLWFSCIVSYTAMNMFHLLCCIVS